MATEQLKPSKSLPSLVKAMVDRINEYDAHSALLALLASDVLSEHVKGNLESLRAEYRKSSGGDILDDVRSEDVSSRQRAADAADACRRVYSDAVMPGVVRDIARKYESLIKAAVDAGVRFLPDDKEWERDRGRVYEAYTYHPGRERKPPPQQKRKRGRPTAGERTPARVEGDASLHRDWKASGLTKNEFLRLKYPSEADQREGRKAIDRAGKHLKKNAN